MTPQDRLLGAIFGRTAEEEAEIEREKAASRAADVAEARALAAQAAEVCNFGRAEHAVWLPGMLYGNPIAFARVGDETLIADLRHEGYYPLSEIDLAALEALA